MVLVSKKVFTIAASYLENNYYYNKYAAFLCSPFYWFFIVVSAFNSNEVIFFNPKKISSTTLHHPFTSYTHLVADYNLFQESLEIPSFPATLTRLFFKFNNTIPILPQSLTHLTLSILIPYADMDMMDQLCNNLPSSLTFFKVDRLTWSSNGFTISTLPPNLIHLHILYSRCTFRLSSLPSSLKYLSTPQWIDPMLTLSLLHLTFANNFDSPVDHLPSSLKHLCFGRRFNQPINNLPRSLTHLTLGYSFNHPIDHLPSSLLHLEIECGDFNHPIDRLPISLSYLSICSFKFQQPLDKLPPCLTSLSISHPNMNYPMEILPIQTQFNLICPVFPPTITKLSLGYGFNDPLPSLPKNLHSLYIGNTSYDHQFPLLPFYLHQLIIMNINYSYPISLPPYLSLLVIGEPVNLPSRHGSREYTLIQRTENERKWVIIWMIWFFVEVPSFPTITFLTLPINSHYDPLSHATSLYEWPFANHTIMTRNKCINIPYPYLSYSSFLVTFLSPLENTPHCF